MKGFSRPAPGFDRRVSTTTASARRRVGYIQRAPTHPGRPFPSGSVRTLGAVEQGIGGVGSGHRGLAPRVPPRRDVARVGSQTTADTLRRCDERMLRIKEGVHARARGAGRGLHPGALDEAAKRRRCGAHRGLRAFQLFRNALSAQHVEQRLSTANITAAPGAGLCPACIHSHGHSQVPGRVYPERVAAHARDGRAGHRRRRGQRSPRPCATRADAA